MTVTVDTSGFTAMTRELSKISGKTHREVIDSEAGRVLGLASKYIGAAKAAAYPRYNRLTEDQKRQWIASKKRGETPAVKILGRGLAKKSWLDIANTLALKIKGVPGYAKNATAQDGKRTISGSGRRDDAGPKYFVELVNKYPLIQDRGRGAFDGAAAIERAIKTRVKAFLNALKFNVFKDMKDRSRKYPGLFTVTQNASA